MGAYNWILVDHVCPVCHVLTTLRAQTHVRSSFAGDDTGRFHDREYRLGEPMAWWPRSDKCFAEPAHADDADEYASDEACYADCTACDAELFVIVRFRENVPVEVLGVGREADWPDGMMR